MSASWRLPRVRNWRSADSEFLQDLSYLALLRTDLVHILHEALPASASVRFGIGFDLEEAADGVRVTLADGTVLTGDLLIGADGFRSGVRQRHFGPDSAFHEPLGYRFATYPLADTLGLGESFLSYAEPGQMAEYYGLRSGGLAALQIWRDPDSTGATGGALAFAQACRRREPPECHAAD
jgi:2-polyprenyl-6-methoxyphenol hydroxylase-like FAD-dependent oxidoreductase